MKKINQKSLLRFVKNKVKKIFIAPLVTIYSYLIFLSDYLHFYFKSKLARSEFKPNFLYLKPCVHEKTEQTSFDRHYVYHVTWALKIMREINPTKHTDISSSLFFCSALSTFIPVDFYDFRPANLVLNGLKTYAANITSLPFLDRTVESLSCMHVLEHIGLGRYGDPIDVQGDLKAISELKRVLKSGAYLLIVVPVGVPIVQFNAHRIYSYEQIINYFSELKLKEFTLIPDYESQGGLIRHANHTLVSKMNYGCGCFLFQA